MQEGLFPDNRLSRLMSAFVCMLKQHLVSYRIVYLVVDSAVMVGPETQKETITNPDNYPTHVPRTRIQVSK